MSKNLTINNKTFTIPTDGQDPGWGQGTTDYLTEVAAVLNSLQGSGDILETTFIVDNSATVATTILGLVFDPNTVRAANIDYSIYRSVDGTGLSESGVIQVIYNDENTEWTLTQTINGDADVTFTILASGQMEYVVTTLSGSNYDGTLTFKARTLSR